MVVTVSELSRPRGRPRGDAQERILAAARDLLAKRSYDMVSVPEIAAAAGVAQGTFYLYFKSKADLLPSLAEMVNARIEERIASRFIAAAPVFELLDNLLDAGIQISSEFSDILPLLASEGLFFGDSQSAEARRAPYLKRLTEQIRTNQANGILRSDITAQNAASLVSGVLDQVARHAVRSGDAFEITQLKQDAGAFLRGALSSKLVL